VAIFIVFDGARLALGRTAVKIGNVFEYRPWVQCIRAEGSDNVGAKRRFRGRAVTR